MHTIDVPPLGRFLKGADLLMVPLMYLAQGCLEEPQQTHFWNNVKFRTVEERACFDRSTMCRVVGDPRAVARSKWSKVPLFHIPILGGWREYAVLLPKHPGIEEWMPGWWAPDVVGVSRVRVRGAVRVLRGPKDTLFFGVDAEGRQIELRIAGYGRIGDNGPYSRLPLR